MRAGDLVGLSGTEQGCPELAPVGQLDGDLLGPMLVRRLEVESGPLPVDVVVIAAVALEQWPGGVQLPISRAAANAGLECETWTSRRWGCLWGQRAGSGVTRRTWSTRMSWAVTRLGRWPPHWRWSTWVRGPPGRFSTGSAAME